MISVMHALYIFNCNILFFSCSYWKKFARGNLILTLGRYRRHSANTECVNSLLISNNKVGFLVFTYITLNKNYPPLSFNHRKHPIIITIIRYQHNSATASIRSLLLSIIIIQPPQTSHHYYYPSLSFNHHKRPIIFTIIRHRHHSTTTNIPSSLL